jgi:hypothetical protein
MNTPSKRGAPVGNTRAVKYGLYAHLLRQRAIQAAPKAAWVTSNPRWTWSIAALSASAPRASSIPPPPMPISEKPPSPSSFSLAWLASASRIIPPIPCRSPLKQPISRSSPSSSFKARRLISLPTNERKNKKTKITEEQKNKTYVNDYTFTINLLFPQYSLTLNFSYAILLTVEAMNHGTSLVAGPGSSGGEPVGSQ